jgi:hypothetical protein
MKKENMLGEIRNNKCGTPMKIIEYNNRMDIKIEFQDDYKVQRNTTYDNFKIGKIKNPYDKTVSDIGFFGEGKFTTYIDSKYAVNYRVWTDMLQRCYSDKHRLKHLAYADCIVCDEWLNFQNFALWYENNYYEVDNERLHIDKDVLYKNNTIYAPERCLFVPQRINMIFMKKIKIVDPDLPNTIRRCTNGFKSSYNGKALGVYKTLDDAIKAHDTKQIEHIKQVAEEYKSKIPEKVYQSLINYGRQS